MIRFNNFAPTTRSALKYMANISRLNEEMLEILAEAVNREVGLPNALITITYVDCSPDLKKAKIGFSVLPDNLAGSALRALEHASGDLVVFLKKRIKLRQMPHLTWEFDATEKEAAKIEKLISEIN